MGTTEMMNLDLSLVRPVLREQAARAFEEGDGPELVFSVNSARGLAFVFDNFWCLKARGIYETALLEAYSGTRGNFAHWPLNVLEFMFREADRGRLRQAGDPLPPGDRVTLYRGVAGRGRFRKVSGMSWTRDLEKAKWFATRFSVPDAGVYQTTVDAPEVYAYVNDRKEDDFIVRARRPRKLDVSLVSR